ncbi:MAG: Flavodoxin/nitric oxide synthase [Hydrocarboniphaga sp.]|uniref:sulfite reductase subunit alpha n=1 Tax=Hydrocarboniphaga sp. TaxID=2033016 RepID=UPI00261903EB|nr:sulfite reductase subunit alpha [Hydrocarboniphaga sp.]MDB5967605.1 Flavodoxin/nitric oxide synthase [Hydrocarboniphaga sp.]
MKRSGAWVAAVTGLLLAMLAVIAVLLFSLQPARFEWRDPGSRRLLVTAGSVTFYLMLFGLLGWRRSRRDRQRNSQAGDAVLVIHSSQTGHAEQIARQTADALQAVNVPAQLVALELLDAAMLGTARRALFIASTTGEGDPPDAALRFIRQVMMEAPELGELRYALLALGDREYSQFCAWGRRLDEWLQEQGAKPLFARIDVNNADPAALALWRSQLGVFAGHALDHWRQPEVRQWQLIERRLLNPGSAGAPCFHIALAPVSGNSGWEAGWEAGDVLALQLPGDPPVLRDYSIASLPSDGGVHLLVRQTRRADGSLGVGSSWLTQSGEIGGTLPALLRSNSSFHAPDDARPVILIGNGTGLAGLRALLKSRIASGAHDNWLIFGERNAEHDFYYREELLAWHGQGALKQLDLVFSRDGERHEYVQDRLRARAPALREWLERGAAIYVCGSAQGMATGVDDALHEILGAAGVEHLRESGRYRRDVY